MRDCADTMQMVKMHRVMVRRVYREGKNGVWGQTLAKRLHIGNQSVFPFSFFVNPPLNLAQTWQGRLLPPSLRFYRSRISYNYILSLISTSRRKQTKCGLSVKIDSLARANICANW